MVPQEIQPGIAASTIQGSLHSYDNRHTLQPWPQSRNFSSGATGSNNGKGEWEEGEIQEHERKQRRRLIGDLSVDTLVQELSRVRNTFAYHCVCVCVYACLCCVCLITDLFCLFFSMA